LSLENGTLKSDYNKQLTAFSVIIISDFYSEKLFQRKNVKIHIAIQQSMGCTERFTDLGKLNFPMVVRF